MKRAEENFEDVNYVHCLVEDEKGPMFTVALAQEIQVFVLRRALKNSTKLYLNNLISIVYLKYINI